MMYLHPGLSGMTRGEMIPAGLSAAGLELTTCAETSFQLVLDLFTDILYYISVHIF